MTLPTSDLIRARLTLSLVRGELLHDGRTEAAEGIETAFACVEEALDASRGPSDTLVSAEAPTAVESPQARSAPPTATVSGSGGPQNSYEVRMTPHPRAVGSCTECGGQLTHAPTCPKLAPAPKAAP